MPSVVTFWQIEADQKEFFQHLLTTGQILVYPSDKKASEAELTAKPLESYLAVGDFYPIVFTRREFILGVVVSVLTHSEHSYVISPIDSSVMGYDPMSRDSNRLKPANLHAYREVLVTQNGRHELRKQPPEFLKWAKSIFKWVQKRNNHDPHGMSLPMTSRAFKEMTNGVELVTY